MTGAQIERAKANDRNSSTKKKKLLYSDEYTEFIEIIKNISLSRVCIKEAMGFAYDKVEAAEEVRIMTFTTIYEYSFLSHYVLSMYTQHTLFTSTLYIHVTFYSIYQNTYHVYDIDRKYTKGVIASRNYRTSSEGGETVFNV